MFNYPFIMSKSEQLQALIDYYHGGNKTQFAKHIGVSPQCISSWLARNTFDLEVIYSKCEGISPEWLISGEGEMLKQPAHTPRRKPDNLSACDYNSSAETRPRIPFTAAAGALSIATGAADEGDCERFPVIHTFPDYDFTIIIEGDSMAPDYLSGDELACAFLNSPADIQWGKPYILDTADGVVFKRIYDGGDSIMCTSINPAGPSFIVNKQELLHIASVVGYVRHT